MITQQFNDSHGYHFEQLQFNAHRQLDSTMPGCARVTNVRVRENQSTTILPSKIKLGRKKKLTTIMLVMNTDNSYKFSLSGGLLTLDDVRNGCASWLTTEEFALLSSSAKGAGKSKSSTEGCTLVLVAADTESESSSK